MSVKTESTIAASLVFIAVMALILALLQFKQTDLMQMQVRQAEKHYKMSVYPQVDIWTADYSKTCDRPAEISIDFNNSGMGPAIIRKAKYCIGEKCFSQAAELTRHLRSLSGFGRDKFKMRAFDKFHDALLKEGDNYQVMRFYDFSDEETYNAVRALASDISITVEYANVYGDIMEPNSEDTSVLKSAPVGFEVCSQAD